MYKWDEQLSKKIHALGKDRFKFWAFLSQHGLWIFVAYAVWLGYISGSLVSLYPLLTSVTISFFGVLIARRIIRRPRPKDIIKTDYKAIFKWSFPSLHASVGFSMATSLAALAIELAGGNILAWIIGFVLLFFAGLISITRLFVGVHYLSDLLVGGAVGILISVIIELL